MSRGRQLNYVPRLLMLIVVSCAACGHPESFLSTEYGAAGPMVPGQDARLMYYGAAGATWTPDGRGIVIAEFDKSVQPPQPCIMILPAAGGSAIWEGCDNRGTYRDSTHILDSYSVGFGGKVLFSTSLRDRKWDLLFRPPDFPSFAHGDLWLSDTAHFTAAHRVLQLYDDVTPPLKAGPSGFVSVSSITWLGADNFLANSSVVTFNGLFSVPQLVRGTVTSSGVTLVPIPGAAPLFGSITAGGSTLVTITGLLTAGAVPVSGGAIAAFAVVPDGANPAAPGGPDRSIVDLSCQSTRCVILTQEAGQVIGSIVSTFWTVPAAGGAAHRETSFPYRINSATISPTGRDALTLEGGYLYLLSNVIQ